MQVFHIPDADSNNMVYQGFVTPIAGNEIQGDEAVRLIDETVRAVKDADPDWYNWEDVFDALLVVGFVPVDVTSVSEAV